jgi:hypothetical protein
MSAPERGEQARKRRQATAAETLDSPIYMANLIGRFALSDPEGAGERMTGLYLLYWPGPKERIECWIPHSLLSHPDLHHRDSDPAGFSMTSRFYLGALGDRAHIMRVSQGPEGVQVICLPTEPEADEYVHFFHHRSVEQWAMEIGYRYESFTEQRCLDRGKSASELMELFASEGWEVREDMRTGTVWARQRLEP